MKTNTFSIQFIANRLFLSSFFIINVSLATAQTLSETKVLDEVVVNGTTKSTQTLDKQGVSYTVLDSSFIAKNNVRSLGDMAKYTPGFEVPQYGSRLTSSMYVRGVGSRINSPSVGVYYENIPLLFKSSLNRHFYNVGKMAVLRGPQGTLYGVNSEGGLVVIDGYDILKQSKNDTPLTSAHISMGNHFSRLAEVGCVLPLTDRLALEADVFYRGTDGYTTNSLLDQKADNMDEAGAKIKLDWQANDNLRMTLFSEFQTVDEKGFAYGQTTVNSENLQADNVHWPATNILGSYKRNIFDAGLNAVLKMADGKWRLQSTTSFQYLNDFMDMDQDYTPKNLLQMSQHQRGKAVSEELNLKGNINNRWSTSTGLFASHQWLTAFSPVYFKEDFTNMLAENIWATMKKASPNFAAMPTNPLALSMEVPGTFRTPSMNLGVFHESHYEIAKDFSATIGLRYDFNRQDLKYETAMLANLNISLMNLNRSISSNIERSHHHSFSQILPKASLHYKDYYLTVSKGYRAGGYNIQMFSDILQKEFMSLFAASPAQTTAGAPSPMQKLMMGDIAINHDEQTYKNIEETISYDPEFSWNYELGGTTNLSFRTGNLNIHYAVFYSKVQDLQLSVMADTYGFGRMMKNAGKSTACGAEIAINGKTNIGKDRGVFYTANYSYTHTKFLDDKRVPFIPTHTAGASLGYQWGRYSLEANMNGRGKIYWDEENTMAQPFYTQFGARLSAEFDRLNVSLWSRNILNYRPILFAFQTQSAMATRTSTYSQLGEPFMLGIDLNLAF